MATGMPSRHSISQEVEMHIMLENGGSLPMACTMRYSVTDPFAVTAGFRSGDGVVTWTFSRDLLVEGLTAATGMGDIRISPVNTGGRKRLRFELASPHGSAVLEGPLAPIERFLAEALDLLPQGDEWQHLNFDTGLAELLNGGA